MMLVNRKTSEFLITIREKLMNSKNWMHRRNYLFFYMAIKKNTSFEFQKTIPTLNYRNIPAEKSIGYKLEFLKIIFNL